MKKMRYLLFIIFLFASVSIHSQEVFVPLSQNAVLKSKTVSQKKNSKGTPLELPFLDDFSFSWIFPTSELWLDKEVFVNQSYGSNPPTIGYATFDALNSKGNLHSNIIPSVTRLADSLTSNPINLNYPNDMSIYLSFFYQPQGNGDAPETNDTLILEYYSPVTQKWKSVWKAVNQSNNSVKEILPSSEKIWQPETAKNETFKQVILPILSTDYLQEGFQFRFKNYVSITGLIPSKIGNGDFWNIDYVYLNKGRNELDTVRTDVAFVNPIGSLLTDYKSVPWRHYVNNQQNVKINDFIQINYKNNDNKTRTIDSLYITFRDTLNLTSGGKLEASASNIGAYAEMKPELPIGGYSFPTHSAQRAVFEIKVKLVTSSAFDPSENNQIAYYQTFNNYYAYDDGVPELGYGISGSGTKNAMLAYQFTTYITDTLRSIEMFFNPTYNNENQKYFDLTIWDDKNGIPGNIIYRQSGIKPEYSGKMLQFYSYPIADTSELVLSGTYYIGWIQTAEALLNVGYDINSNAQNHIFYNIDGSWQNSSRQGALLIRPVFRKELITGIEPILPNETQEISLSPNPATDFIQINSQEPQEEFQLKIYDLSGKLILHRPEFYTNTPFSIETLKKGMYLLVLQSEKKVFKTKLIKN